MKSCPTCRRLFPDDAGFCPVDGVELKAVQDVAPETNADDPRVGQLIADRYQLRRVVADGGMGRVYEALDMAAQRRVALKVLHGEVARDKVALERFKREYEISQQLPHEHIVEVYDFLRLADRTYALAMDYLEGEELRALLKREKALRPARVVRMLSQLAIGLDEAHRRQLIHRDIKPDNVFLCGTHEGDLVKLLDFGSVKDKSEGAKKLTVMGTTIGSPFYMSPEQAQGLDTLDARADVWALAVICYESLTGRVPFTGNNGPSILLSILTQEPKLLSIVAREQGLSYSIPPTVDEVLKACFEKEASTRVPSVGLMADQLGMAFGLQGSHRDWAYLPEKELQYGIDQVLPLLVEKGRTKAIEAFDPFAMVEADPFEANRGTGLNMVAPNNPYGKEGMSTQDLRAVLTPKGLPLALIVGLIVGVLFVVVSLLLLFLLLR